MGIGFPLLVLLGTRGAVTMSLIYTLAEVSLKMLKKVYLLEWRIHLVNSPVLLRLY